MYTGILRIRLFTCVILMVLPGIGLAQPALTSLCFAPTAIATSSGPATVTVNFTATDNSAGISYFETAFVDPSGVFYQRASRSYSPALTSGTASSVNITFPQFSPAGTWTLAYVFIADANGFTLFLNAPTACSPAATLQVSSVSDTTPPNITALSFTPTSIDTSAASANVVVNFSLTDDLSGANFFQITFTSPSGVQTQSSSATFTPATSVTGSVTLTFPRFSEPGTWTITSAIWMDAAGNTSVRSTADLSARGFPTTLTVTTTPDTTPPSLTAFSFSPSTISTNGSPVVVSFTETDNISGAATFQVVFLSPTGIQSQTGAMSFAPATSFSGSVTINFPSGLEQGTWTVSEVFVSDAAGNTQVLSAANLGGAGFPNTLTVNPPGADTTPPVIIPTVNPFPNGAGWNNSLPVTVTWLVTDPESGIQSSTGCGMTTVTSPTTGTTVTCTATNNANLTSTVSVVVMIDIAAPVTTNTLATPNPVIVNTPVTISATVTDTGGSHVTSAEFQVDGGPFDDLGGAFGTDSVNVSLALPATFPILTTTGVHNICVRGTDLASNVGATQCVLFAVYDPNGGFATGGGGTNSIAGADAANPTGSGPATFAFNPKYVPNNNQVPQGNLEFDYPAGGITFKASVWDFLVLTNGNRGQAQGTGTLTDASGTSTCKFSLDAWDNSFQPGNVDAFGFSIFNCNGGTATRYNLSTAPTTKGNIVVHSN